MYILPITHPYPLASQNSYKKTTLIPRLKFQFDKRHLQPMGGQLCILWLFRPIGMDQWRQVCKILQNFLGNQSERFNCVTWLLLTNRREICNFNRLFLFFLFIIHKLWSIFEALKGLQCYKYWKFYKNKKIDTTINNPAYMKYIKLIY